MKTNRSRSYLIGSCCLLLLGAGSPIKALTCLYQDDDQFMRHKYEGETVFSCDTVTVPEGDTAMLMYGSRFSWNKKLESNNRVLIVKGTMLGMGDNGFYGSTDTIARRARWDGIRIDSCANVDFETVSIHNALYALQLHSRRVHIKAGVFFESAGILLPDSSVLRRDYLKDTILDFRSEDLPAMARSTYRCKDEIERLQPGSDSWDWRDKLYWSVIGVLAGVAIWIWTLNLKGH